MSHLKFPKPKSINWEQLADLRFDRNLWVAEKLNNCFLYSMQFMNEQDFESQIMKMDNNDIYVFKILDSNVMKNVMKDEIMFMNHFMYIEQTREQSHYNYFDISQIEQREKTFVSECLITYERILELCASHNVSIMEKTKLINRFGVHCHIMLRKMPF